LVVFVQGDAIVFVVCGKQDLDDGERTVVCGGAKGGCEVERGV